MVLKIRYTCGHEIDFERDDKEAPKTRREQRLAQEGFKCPACRHETVKLQLISSKRVRNWK